MGMVRDSHKVVEAQPAYVLHRTPYKESSFLLDVFTRDYGALRLVAKGAGRKKSAGGAQLQVFQPLLLNWSGRSELKTLTGFEAPSLPISLPGERLYCAYYLNELLLYLAPPLSRLGDMFVFYAQALAELVESATPELPLRRFELRLLGDLGLKPDFACSSEQLPVLPDKLYYLNDENSFELLENETAQMRGVQGDIPSTYSGEVLLWLSADCPEGTGGWAHMDNVVGEHAARPQASLQTVRSRQAKRLMRKLIDRALNGRPLKSREMLRQMTRVKE